MTPRTRLDSKCWCVALFSQEHLAAAARANALPVWNDDAEVVAHALLAGIEHHTIMASGGFDD